MPSLSLSPSREPRSAPSREESARCRTPETIDARRLRSETLLDGRREVVIEHAGHEYRLRHTYAGKLILTK